MARVPGAGCIPSFRRTISFIVPSRAFSASLQAFFGLVASGWSLDDFDQRGSPARLPNEALWAENIVGLFDLERATGHVMAAAEFTAALAASLSAQGRPPFRSVTDADLARVRALVADLRGRWQVMAVGDTLAIPFPMAAA